MTELRDLSETGLARPEAGSCAATALGGDRADVSA